MNVTGGPRTGRNATRSSAVVVEPIQDGTFAFELYAGPQEWRRLLALGRDFENSNPYGGFLQGVVQPFATIVMRILLWMRATLEPELWLGARDLRHRSPPPPLAAEPEGHADEHAE